MSREEIPAHGGQPPPRPDWRGVGGEEPLRSLGYIDCLGYCLERRGEQYPKALLMGFSGESFRFFYDRNDPNHGPYVVSHNPLRAAASALGYSCDILFHGSLPEAIQELADRVEAGQTPIIRLRADWAVVVGLTDAGFRIWLPGGRTEEYPRWQLEENWLREQGFLELGLLGYYLFLLGEKQRVPKQKEAATGSLRRGFRLVTRKTPVSGCSAGLEAYQDLMDSLKRKRKRSELRAIGASRYAQWSSAPREYVHASRKSAAQFLDLVSPNFSEEEQSHLQKAADKYRQAAALLDEMPQPEPPDQGGAAIKYFWWRKRRAASLIKQLYWIEKEAADELRRAIQSAERSEANS